MLEWLKSLGTDGKGLEFLVGKFNQMLVDGRHMFDLSSTMLLSGSDPETIRKDLFKTDKKINRNEQKLRRRLLIHASVRGATELPTCLALMNLGRDAERIGDYCKNLFDIAKERHIPVKSPHHADLADARTRLSKLLGRMIKIYLNQDQEEARQYLRAGDSFQDLCDSQVSRIITSETSSSEAVVTALAYRFFKRICAHSTNIISSIVQPLDKLGYIPSEPGGEEEEG